MPESKPAPTPTAKPGKPAPPLSRQASNTLEANEEDTVIKRRCKLCRYDKSSAENKWVSLGTGEIRILRHRDTHTERLFMRQEKTTKVILNALLDPRIVLTKNVVCDRVWVWSCFDYSSEAELKEESFSAMFGNAADTADFKQAFDQGQTNMLSHVFDAKTNLDGDSSSTELAAAVPLLDDIEFECPLCFQILQDPVRGWLGVYVFVGMSECQTW